MTSEGFEILKDMNMSIFVVDDSGRFVFVNRSFVRLTGRSETDLLGKRIDEVFGTELKKALRIINEAIKNGKCVCDFDVLTLHRGTGADIKFDLTAGRVYHEGKIAALVSLWDMSIHARRDDLREEYSKKLEAEVKKRTEELQTKANELENFYRLTVGRELKMSELKGKIKELEDRLKSREEPL